MTDDPRDKIRPVPLIPLIADAKELAFAEFHRRLDCHGHDRIRDGHGCVFRFIDVEGTRLTTLADRAGFTKQAVGEIVDDLEQLGYAERIPDPSDRRAKLIRLTDRGLDAYGVGLEVFDEIEREWAERFGAERVAVLRELLEELVAEELAGRLTVGAAPGE
ncbi:MAG TPA: MarR family transcriptional regulator [Solirubrobacterales bacterium]|nr:MarR family transcriptional regulator [Solirubrobacterales bacterium]